MNFIIFLTFIFSLSACVAQKSKVFDSSSLKEAGGNDLIIESAGDGTGSYASGSSYVAGQTATFYAVQRTPINRFIGTTSVTWSIDAKLGYFLTSAVGNSVTVQFTGDGRTTNGTDTAFLMAAKTGFTTRQALLTVTAGTPSKLVIETSSDGSAAEFTGGSYVAGSSQTLYAVSRDAYENFVDLVSVTWTNPNDIGYVDSLTGVSTTFYATRSGSNVILAADGVLGTDSSGTLIVSAGTASVLSIETATDGSGSVVDTATLTAGNTMNLAAVARDSFGNYVGSEVVTWSVPGAIVSFDANPANYVTITGAIPHISQPVSVTLSTLTSDSTGNITVENNLPVANTTQQVYFNMGTVSNFDLTAATDADTSHILTYAQVTAPTIGTLTDCAGLGASTSTDLNCNYTSTATSAQYSFTYSANDGYENASPNGNLTLNVMINDWIWRNSNPPASSDDTNQSAAFITAQGVAATTNIPGARKGMASWSDSDGFVWIFGGMGRDSVGATGYLNDLWKYNTSTKEWSWMSGAQTFGQGTILTDASMGGAATELVPGARENAASWIVSNGIGDHDLYLFGGQGPIQASGSIIIQNNSTIEGGDVAVVNGVNFPIAIGATSSATALLLAQAINNSIDVAIDGIVSAYADGASAIVTLYADQTGTSGNALTLSETDNVFDNMLLSGVTFADGVMNASNTGYYNDLWKYNTSSGQWSRLKYVSTTTTSQDGAGTFGTQGMGSASTIPSARMSSAAWVNPTDSTKLILYGGLGIDSAAAKSGYVQDATLMGSLLGDMWEYDTASSNWTWKSGQSTHGQSGVYGTITVESSANIPGARFGSNVYVDGTYMWLLGGMGYPQSGGYGVLNDLWRYNLSTGQWAWMSGNKTRNELGVYGTIMTATSTNMPGGRYFAHGWTDSRSRKWLQGGLGYGAAPTLGYLDDLWLYDGVNWVYVKGDSTVDQDGDFGVIDTESTLSHPGGKAQGAAFVNTASNTYWLFGGMGYPDLGAAGAGTVGFLHDLFEYLMEL